MAAPYRNPANGLVTYPVTAMVRVEPLPRIYRLASWEALAELITSDSFPGDTETLSAARAA